VSARTRERTAHTVARVGDIPEGAHVVVRAGAREYGIFNVRGRYHAIPNRCLHQGGPLCRGRLGATLTASAETDWRPRWEQEGEIITCPWHQLEFSVVTGRCLAHRNRRLATFEVVVDGDELKLLV
jgi:nitrite reductase (NADH) small subunit